jgi:hypothetical protein
VDINDGQAALAALGGAASALRQEILRATAPNGGGALSPMEAVILLDDAFGQLHELMAVVPGLLAVAPAGEPVQAGLTGQAAEQTALADQVRAARRELELAEAGKQAAQDRLDELAGLREQVDELRRRERLVAALDELADQRQVIEERLVLLRQRTGAPEEALAARAGELVTLAGERRALLAPRARETLAQAGEVCAALAQEEERARAEQERLTATREQLSGAEQRLAELEAERTARLGQLAAHAEAERALAAVLPPDGHEGTNGAPAGRLRSMLDTMTTQLAEVDDVLRDALATVQASYNGEHAVLRYAAPQG